MKHKMFLFIVCGVILSFFPADALAQEGKAGLMNETLQTIFHRKSVRDYTDQPVEKEKLEMLVRAGMAAPTAMDRRPWTFVIVTDRALLTQLGETAPYVGMLKTAQAAIIVCGVKEKFIEGPAGEYWVQDVSAATENILLAAESMGLGAVWTGAYPMMERVAKIREILTIPDSIIPLAMVPVGYPAGNPQPKDKFDDKNIHWGKW